jgi:hypothetical protein
LERNDNGLLDLLVHKVPTIRHSLLGILIFAKILMLISESAVATIQSYAFAFKLSLVSLGC